MLLKYIYITWKYLLRTLAGIVVLFTILALLLFGLAQLPFAQKYVSTATQTYFNQNFNGTLQIGAISGLVPFSMQLDQVMLLESDHTESDADTLISIERIDIRINPLDFFRRSISVQSLQIDNPMVRLTLEHNGDVYKIERAFQRTDQHQHQEPPRLEDLEIFAPFLTIANGKFIFEKRQPGLLPEFREEPIIVDNIQFSAFAELSEVQRYLDVYFLFANVPDWSEHTFRIRGQVFNDNRFLELNAFRVELGESIINITGEADRVDVLSADFRKQILESPFSARIDTAYIRGEDLSFLHPSFGEMTSALSIQLMVEGDISDLSVSQSRIVYGKSELEFVGDLQHVLDVDRLLYDGYLRQFRIDKADLYQLLPQTEDYPFTDWNLLTLQGRIYGTVNRTDADLIMNTRKGKISLQGDIQWGENPDYHLQLTTDGLDLGQFVSLDLPTSSINATILLQGNGFLKETAHISADITMYNTYVGAFSFDELAIEGDYFKGDIDATLQWLKNGSVLNSEITFNTNGRSELYLAGSASAFNLKEVLDITQLADTELDMEFDIQVNNPRLENMTGVISLDVVNGSVNGESVQPHQFYADLLESSAGQRIFRFTSTLADAQIEGDVFPGRVVQMLSYWSDYVEERVEDEFIFTEDGFSEDDESMAQMDGMNLNVELQIKDLTLLSHYFPDSPQVRSRASLTTQIIANQSRMLLNGRITSSDFAMNDIQVQNTDIQFSSTLQYGRKLQDFAAIDVQVRTGAFQKGNFAVDHLDASLSMLNETARFDVSSQRVGNDTYRLNLSAQTMLSDSTISLKITDFDLGSTQYAWTLESDAIARYTQDRKFHIDNLRFANAQQVIDIRGTYSFDLDDAMEYRLINVDLAQISEIIGGKSSFAGVVDGEFSSQSLLREPAIAGNLFVDGFTLDGRIAGDITINSTYNPLSDRFNTNIQVLTDPEKYAEYLAANNGRGNNINITGWFQAPDGDVVPADTLYYFDVDMPQIDGWILVPILPYIFVESEGSASGSGIFTGNAQDFYFNAKFDIEELQVIPEFVFTNYILSGEVILDRHDGVFLNEIAVRDLSNGTGVLNGTVSFNDFLPERPFDLTLSLNRLQFLNNSFSNDVPFYGTVAGTGRVALTGSNLAPYLRTITPVTTTSNSRLTIPLLAETSVEEQARFIEFVQSFDELFRSREVETQDEAATVFRELTFVEIARLDLQFIAPPATTVQLLFDPLTGEVLNAQGSGRIRITLEDEEFQMFGNFNVTSGEYTFVAGDIFLRRFQLRNGGTINWEGDPANAQLNMTAAYRARPNIGVLTGRTLDLQTRIPVDLMLEITGTIQSIENDFFFEFPNAVDVTQNATELALLNSEDQKLIQATSLLFTGGFLPVGVGGDGQFADLGTSLQSRAGQVGLSQLLSNQINTLLNSNLSNLDVDLNLTGFDQADLGIALRLFNDRLILRGESQFYTAAETGAETMLGDLGVTYRINRNLSVEVFHRRDPTLRSIVGNQTQAESINGIGLEAQVQFNTWRELSQRWWGQIRRVFGLSETEHQEDGQVTSS